MRVHELEPVHDVQRNGAKHCAISLANCGKWSAMNNATGEGTSNHVSLCWSKRQRGRVTLCRLCLSRGLLWVPRDPLLS